MNERRGKLFFFLGGHDLEMETIRELLEQAAPGRFCDKGLSWGARASAYEAEIREVLAKGDVPVLIELEEDIGLREKSVVIVDHHGARAGESAPTSLHQIFRMLGLPPERWTRRYDLVAANDRGYIPALTAMGATREDIERVRREDRAAQGITKQEESAAEEAISKREILSGGKLTVVRLPHSKTAAVTDRMAPVLDGEGYKNLLVISPRKVNFFGNGDLVYRLDKAFPCGWMGGALPERGFWGNGSAYPSKASVVDFLRCVLDAGANNDLRP